jgi:hypothetical protein
VGGYKIIKEVAIKFWYSPEGKRISIQNRKGVTKGYQVRQFLGDLKGEDNEQKR